MHPDAIRGAALDEHVHAHVLDDPLPPPDDDADPPLYAAVRTSEAAAPGPAGTGSADPDADPELDPGTHPGNDSDSGTHPGPAFLTATATTATTASTATTRTTTPTAPSAPSATPADDARIRHMHAAPDRPPLRRRRAFRAAVGAALGIALLSGVGLTVYLYQSARAWRDQADDYLREAQHLGQELSTTRSDLTGAQAELAAVRDQLAAAHQRITELASEKAQISDEWEITQQLVDYQERISNAAGDVALALDQCVRSQQELIGYLARAAEPPSPGASPSPPPYDPAQLEQFESDVEAFCQEASEANLSLQQELAR